MRHPARSREPLRKFFFFNRKFTFPRTRRNNIFSNVFFLVFLSKSRAVVIFDRCLILKKIGGEWNDRAATALPMLAASHKRALHLRKRVVYISAKQPYICAKKPYICANAAQPTLAETPTRAT